MAGKPKPIKVCLTNSGIATETPWADDLGPAPGPSGARRVRLLNVPFLHAKPTWGDVIVVSPSKGGMPTWDRRGASWREVAARIAEDGGRWAMIVDFVPHDDTGSSVAFRALSEACGEHGIVCEAAWPAKPDTPGRAYLAVEHVRSDADVMAALRDAELPCELIQVHPAAAKPRAKKLPAHKPKKPVRRR